MTTDVKVILESLPRDLAASVALSALSGSPEKIQRSMELAIGLNALRLLAQEERLLAEEERLRKGRETAEKIVEDIMGEFHAKLNTVATEKSRK